MQGFHPGSVGFQNGPDRPLLPGVKLIGHRAETHSILMRARSGTVRHIQAVHQLDRKSTPLREAFLKDL